MNLISPSFNFEEDIDGVAILQKIERAGRTSYKSESKITSDSAFNFVKMIIKRGHLSVLEHHSICVRIICDRGVSHEIVRHRIASYTQESTRYCNYSKGQFNNQITVIKPFFWDNNNFDDKKKYEIWEKLMNQIEQGYNELIAAGAKPEEARSILPNSLKTEIVMTMNLREWRHFFKLRTAEDAHPQMQEITIPLLAEFRKRVPVIFDDINLD